MHHDLPEKIEEIVKSADLKGFLRQQVGKISSSIMNSGSRCRIVPMPVPSLRSRTSASSAPRCRWSLEMSASAATRAWKCLQAAAVAMTAAAEKPEIDIELCVKCGQCARACPTGTIDTGRTGFRVLVGGKPAATPGWPGAARHLFRN
ncbi:MAG: 4Fe-4S binding protein [Desulfobacterales bacterium]